MVNSKNKTAIRECQICLEKIYQAYILDCSHIFCQDCIKTFCETQFENSSDPSCPVCLNPIIGDCLQNLFGQVPNKKHKVNKHVMPTKQTKKIQYSCPRCHDSDIKVNLKEPTKAVCDCEYTFCTECYHKWGRKHFCLKTYQEVKQMEEECKQLKRKRSSRIKETKQVQFVAEPEEEESEEEVETSFQRAIDAEEDHKLKMNSENQIGQENCPFCKKEFTKYHNRNPFKACGKEYHVTDKDQRSRSAALYMIYDIL